MSNMLKAIVLVLSNSIEEIRALVAEGFCPVECSIGGESIVDALEMDHHGKLSHLEGVAVRAYRDQFAARKSDPRFVVCGTADADACFAIASLAGLLPHPSRAAECTDKTPPAVKKSLTADLGKLAETVNLLDVNPIGVDVTKVAGGDIVKTWNSLTSSNKDNLGLYTGVGLWVNLTTGIPSVLATYFAASKAAEEARIVEATADLDERCERIGDMVAFLNNSRAWGFDVWYGRQLSTGTSEEIRGWSAPVVVALTERDRKVTLGAPNMEVAEALFGKGGLKNVFAALSRQSMARYPEMAQTAIERDRKVAESEGKPFDVATHIPAEFGWGGREAIGGSPREMKLTGDDARAAAELVASLIKS